MLDLETQACTSSQLRNSLNRGRGPPARSCFAIVMIADSEVNLDDKGY